MSITLQNLGVTVNAKGGPTESSRNHHNNILAGQLVFIRKDITGIGPNTWAANLKDVNNYIVEEITANILSSPSPALANVNGKYFFADDVALKKIVLSWSPWGNNLTETLRGSGPFGSGVILSIQPVRQLRVNFSGRAVIDANDIYNVSQAYSGSTLFVELHWKPVDILTATGSKTVYMPEFRVMAMMDNDYSRSASIDANTHYHVLRWAYGHVVFNKNCRVAQLGPHRLPASILASSLSVTPVEVNLHLSIYSLFSDVPIPHDYPYI